ncbi:oxidoreductase [Rhodoferax koreense]|uniref:Oxidoreductase n=1 Tax=Rhodoferax koreensis TaxID=1842727 RepID=A0A1P8JQM6_9BURK|nr:Gfo/Idh/MocA family oxidoreductase [Rhodoferax koreense]APW36035.1 oxidoreductase [Rhodoferax koreense]
MRKLRLAVIGAGAIGRTHIALARDHALFELVAIVDGSAPAQTLAAQIGVPYHTDVAAMLSAEKPDAVIVATPNATHADIGVMCLAADVHVLVEKPITDTLADARRLCAAADAAGKVLLVGHQRRYNGILRAARGIVQSGRLGQLVSATGMATFLKPDPYFDMAWRRRQGGGPILINLIHDIDLLRFLMGEIDSVQAASANAVRGFEVEDTAAVILRFKSGALATMTVSDSTTAPWNWDLAAGESAHYPRQDVNTHFISGTHGSVTLPRLEVWEYRSDRGWHQPLTQERIALHDTNPYAEQLRHFDAVIRGQEEPVCSGVDAMRSLQAVLAIHETAASGEAVQIGD